MVTSWMRRLAGVLSLLIALVVLVPTALAIAPTDLPSQP